MRCDLDGPLLGMEKEGGLVGVAGIDEPGHKEWPPSLVDTYERVKAVLGTEATECLEAYASLPDPHRPSEAHFCLGVIGVHHSQQGQGHARELLDEIHARVESHPSAVGIALDTANSVNMPIYQHFGYKLVCVDEEDILTVWTMLKPMAT